jgi:hypothetical protein
MTNDKRQVAKAVAQQVATSSKLYTLITPTMTSLLHENIHNRVGPMRVGLVEDTPTRSRNVVPTLVATSLVVSRTALAASHVV